MPVADPLPALTQHLGIPCLFPGGRPAFAGIMCGIDPRSGPFAGAEALLQQLA